MDNNGYTQTGRKFPNKVRDLKLLSNDDPIMNATPSPSDPRMKMLATLWWSFIEPHSERSYHCPKCLANILENFRQLKPTLIELKKQNDILSLIK